MRVKAKNDKRREYCESGVVLLWWKGTCEVQDELLKIIAAKHPHVASDDLIGRTGIRSRPRRFGAGAETGSTLASDSRFCAPCHCRRSGDGQGWEGGNRPRRAGFYLAGGRQASKSDHCFV